MSLNVSTMIVTQLRDVNYNLARYVDFVKAVARLTLPALPGRAKPTP